MKIKLKKLIQDKKFLCIFIFFLGALSSLSLPPYNYFYINFFTLSFFFTLLIKKKSILSKKHYFLFGWIFGFGYFLSSLYWIAISLTFESDLKILIPISLILIPAFLALFYAIPVYIFSYFTDLRIINLILLFSILFGFSEFFRGYIFTGFPWNLFVYSFSNNIEFIQTLSIFGTYGLNLLCISFFLIPSIFFFNRKFTDTLISLIFFLIFLSFFLIGNSRLDKKNIFNNFEDNFQIKIISSNIGIDRFYNSENEIEIINKLVEVSNPEKNIPTLFIWPEGIITSSYLKDVKKYENLFKNFSNNDAILFGINDLVLDDNKKVFNSLVLTDNKLNVKSLYYKNKLVPFGEFLPIESILKKVGLRAITNNFSSFSKGKDRDLINIHFDNISLKILPLICYEIIYSGELSKQNSFNIIVNISEDGWFGKSIGPYQHFTHSIFRAIEEGKTVLRSSNNGISAIINPKGKIIKSTQGGVIRVAEFENLNKFTIFSMYGRNNIFFYLAAIYITLIFFLKRIGR